MTERQWREVGSVDALDSGGTALLFDIDEENFENGFAVRFGDAIYCYRNRCPHLGSPLDWNQGEFFSGNGEHLVCSTHGARFDPATGLCVSGPCRGQKLLAVEHEIRSGRLYVRF